MTLPKIRSVSKVTLPKIRSGSKVTQPTIRSGSKVTLPKIRSLSRVTQPKIRSVSKVTLAYLRSDRCPSPQIRSLCKVTVQVDPNQAKVTVQVDLAKGQATILGHSPSEPNLRSRLSVVSVGSDERFVVKFMLSSSSNIFLHENRGNKPAMYICGLTVGWTDKMGQFTGLFIEWLIYGFVLFYFGN